MPCHASVAAAAVTTADNGWLPPAPASFLQKLLPSGATVVLLSALDGNDAESLRLGELVLSFSLRVLARAQALSPQTMAVMC